jgi:hypothetical protein
VLTLKVSNTPGHPLTPLYKVFLQQFVCLKLKMKCLVFKEAEYSFLHSQEHASKVYSQPAQSCPYLSENPSKIITLKNAAWNLQSPHALQILFISSIYNFLHAYYVLHPAHSSKYN